jgi:ABC-type tungstate transport system permease subunit
VSVAHVTLPAQSAAGATATTVVHAVEATNDNGMNFAGAKLVSPSLVTGVNTNNATFNVRHLRAGASLGTLASLQLVSGTNLPANVAVSVPVNAAYVPAFQLGDVIDVQMVQNGAGVAIPAGVRAQVEIN